MSTRSDLRTRLALAEAQAGVGEQLGALAFAVICAADAISDRPCNIVGIEVTVRGRRCLVERLPDESLEALHWRGNPSGSWRARPVPLYASRAYVFCIARDTT